MKTIKENKDSFENFKKIVRITEGQFYGTETVGGSLDLRGLTSIPEGFNPTVGGSLYLSGNLSALTKKTSRKNNYTKK